MHHEVPEASDASAGKRSRDLRYEWGSARPALERLFASLDQGEVVLEVARGTFFHEPGYLAVTNRRVVFGMAIPFLPFINRTVKLAHQAVAGVEVERRPWGAQVRVLSPAVQPVIGGLEPAEADRIAELIRQRAHLPEHITGQAPRTGENGHSRFGRPPRSKELQMATTHEPQTHEEQAPSRPSAAPSGWYPNPTGPGRRYWNGEAWTDSYAPAEPAPPDGDAAPQSSRTPQIPAVEQQGTPGLVIAGYVFAVLMPIVGFVLGIVAVTRPERRVSKHGVWIIVTAVVAFVIYLAIATASQ